MLIRAEPGTEKWLPWAKSRYAWMKGYLESGCGYQETMDKNYVPEDGTLVRIRASVLPYDNCNWIIITGGTIKGFTVFPYLIASDRTRVCNRDFTKGCLLTLGHLDSNGNPVVAPHIELHAFPRTEQVVWSPVVTVQDSGPDVYTREFTHPVKTGKVNTLTSHSPATAGGLVWLYEPLKRILAYGLNNVLGSPPSGLWDTDKNHFISRAAGVAEPWQYIGSEAAPDGTSWLQPDFVGPTFVSDVSYPQNDPANQKIYETDLTDDGTTISAPGGFDDTPALPAFPGWPYTNLSIPITLGYQAPHTVIQWNATADADNTGSVATPTHILIDLVADIKVDGITFTTDAFADETTLDVFPNPLHIVHTLSGLKGSFTPIYADATNEVMIYVHEKPTYNITEDTVYTRDPVTHDILTTTITRSGTLSVDREIGLIIGNTKVWSVTESSPTYNWQNDGSWSPHACLTMGMSGYNAGVNNFGVPGGLSGDGINVFLPLKTPWCFYDNVTYKEFPYHYSAGGFTPYRLSMGSGVSFCMQDVNNWFMNIALPHGYPGAEWDGTQRAYDNNGNLRSVNFPYVTSYFRGKYRGLDVTDAQLRTELERFLATQTTRPDIVGSVTSKESFVMTEFRDHVSCNTTYGAEEVPATVGLCSSSLTNKM